jgi:Zn-finger nucleic acid-binding protein
LFVGSLPSTFISSSGIFTSKEVEEISQKNAEKLSAMTQAEILEEQEKLLSQLDPKVADFLKKGRQPSTGKKRNTEETDKKSVKFTKFDDIKEISEDDLPIRPSESWVNMDKVELDKLQWMAQLPPPSPFNSSTGHSVRFDFKGR